MSRTTPYRGIRYPLSGEVVDQAAIQTMAQDIDQALVNDDMLRTEGFRRSSLMVYTTASINLPKSALVPITWTTASWQDGANGIPSFASWWSASTNPTRFTAPSACLVHATANAGISNPSLGSGGFFEIFFYKNGSASTPNLQANKSNQPNYAVTVESMWAMSAGDYIECGVLWNGSPAGPLTTSGATVGWLSVIGVP